MAGNILKGISQNERERAIFRSRRKFQTDYDSDMATSRFLGAKETQIQIARNALGMNMPVKDVVDLTGLTREEVERLQSAE